MLAYLPSPPRGVWYLGPIPIRAYALCIIAGILVALWWTQRRWVAWIEALRIDHANHFLGLRLNDWTSLIVFPRRGGLSAAAPPAPGTTPDGPRRDSTDVLIG